MNPMKPMPLTNTQIPPFMIAALNSDGSVKHTADASAQAFSDIIKHAGELLKHDALKMKLTAPRFLETLDDFLRKSISTLLVTIDHHMHDPQFHHQTSQLAEAFLKRCYISLEALISNVQAVLQQKIFHKNSGRGAKSHNKKMTDSLRSVISQLLSASACVQAGYILIQCQRAQHDFYIQKMNINDDKEANQKIIGERRAQFEKLMESMNNAITSLLNQPDYIPQHQPASGDTQHYFGISAIKSVVEQNFQKTFLLYYFKSCVDIEVRGAWVMIVGEWISDIEGADSVNSSNGQKDFIQQLDGLANKLRCLSQCDRPVNGVLPLRRRQYVFEVDVDGLNPEEQTHYTALVEKLKLFSDNANAAAMNLESVMGLVCDGQMPTHVKKTLCEQDLAEVGIPNDECFQNDNIILFNPQSLSTLTLRQYLDFNVRFINIAITLIAVLQHIRKKALPISLIKLTSLEIQLRKMASEFPDVDAVNLLRAILVRAWLSHATEASDIEAGYFLLAPLTSSIAVEMASIQQLGFDQTSLIAPSLLTTSLRYQIYQLRLSMSALPAEMLRQSSNLMMMDAMYGEALCNALSPGGYSSAATPAHRRLDCEGSPIATRLVSANGRDLLTRLDNIFASYKVLSAIDIVNTADLLFNSRVAASQMRAVILRMAQSVAELKIQSDVAAFSGGIAELMQLCQGYLRLLAPPDAIDSAVRIELQQLSLWFYQFTLSLWSLEFDLQSNFSKALTPNMPVKVFMTNRLMAGLHWLQSMKSMLDYCQVTGLVCQNEMLDNFIKQYKEKIGAFVGTYFSVEHSHDAVNEQKTIAGFLLEMQKIIAEMGGVSLQFTDPVNAQFDLRDLLNTSRSIIAAVYRPAMQDTIQRAEALDEEFTTKVNVLSLKIEAVKRAPTNATKLAAMAAIEAVANEAMKLVDLSQLCARDQCGSYFNYLLMFIRSFRKTDAVLSRIEMNLTEMLPLTDAATEAQQAVFRKTWDKLLSSHLCLYAETLAMLARAHDRIKDVHMANQVLPERQAFAVQQCQTYGKYVQLATIKVGIMSAEPNLQMSLARLLVENFEQQLAPFIAKSYQDSNELLPTALKDAILDIRASVNSLLAELTDDDAIDCLEQLLSAIDAVFPDADTFFLPMILRYKNVHDTTLLVPQWSVHAAWQHRDGDLSSTTQQLHDIDVLMHSVEKLSADYHNLKVQFSLVNDKRNHLVMGKIEETSRALLARVADSDVSSQGNILVFDRTHGMTSRMQPQVPLAALVKAYAYLNLGLIESQSYSTSSTPTVGSFDNLYSLLVQGDVPFAPRLAIYAEMVTALAQAVDGTYAPCLVKTLDQLMLQLQIQAEGLRWTLASPLAASLKQAVVAVEAWMGRIDLSESTNTDGDEISVSDSVRYTCRALKSRLRVAVQQQHVADQFVSDMHRFVADETPLAQQLVERAATPVLMLNDTTDIENDAEALRRFSLMKTIMEALHDAAISELHYSLKRVTLAANIKVALVALPQLSDKLQAYLYAHLQEINRVCDTQIITQLQQEYTDVKRWLHDIDTACSQVALDDVECWSDYLSLIELAFHMLDDGLMALSSIVDRHAANATSVDPSWPLFEIAQLRLDAILAVADDWQTGAVGLPMLGQAVLQNSALLICLVENTAQAILSPENKLVNGERQLSSQKLQEHCQSIQLKLALLSKSKVILTQGAEVVAIQTIASRLQSVAHFMSTSSVALLLNLTRFGYQPSTDTNHYLQQHLPGFLAVIRELLAQNQPCFDLLEKISGATQINQRQLTTYRKAWRQWQQSHDRQKEKLAGFSTWAEAPANICYFSRPDDGVVISMGEFAEQITAYSQLGLDMLQIVFTLRAKKIKDKPAIIDVIANLLVRLPVQESELLQQTTLPCRYAVLTTLAAHQNDSALYAAAVVYIPAIVTAITANTHPALEAFATKHGIDLATLHQSLMRFQQLLDVPEPAIAEFMNYYQGYTAYLRNISAAETSAKQHVEDAEKCISSNKEIAKTKADSDASLIIVTAHTAAQSVKAAATKKANAAAAKMLASAKASAAELMAVAKLEAQTLSDTTPSLVAQVKAELVGKPAEAAKASVLAEANAIAAANTILTTAAANAASREILVLAEANAAKAEYMTAAAIEIAADSIIAKAKAAAVSASVLLHADAEAASAMVIARAEAERMITVAKAGKPMTAQEVKTFEQETISAAAEAKANVIADGEKIVAAGKEAAEAKVADTILAAQSHLLKRAEITAKKANALATAAANNAAAEILSSAKATAIAANAAAVAAANVAAQAVMQAIEKAAVIEKQTRVFDAMFAPYRRARSGSAPPFPRVDVRYPGEGNLSLDILGDVAPPISRAYVKLPEPERNDCYLQRISVDSTDQRNPVRVGLFSVSQSEAKITTLLAKGHDRWHEADETVKAAQTEINARK